MYLRSVGLRKGYAWCAAFVHWCMLESGVPNKINGAAASAHNSKNLVWFKNKQLQEPVSGDVFTLWFSSMNRIAHTGFFHRKINNSIYESVEGNTNEAGSREGDGVYKKYRSFRATYSISRWTQ
ncbi:CHAP domain-containing protein [Chitinophagaceae bacterium 26-R-25]|nr:CHAP domain-containing protein [Chitinophagaceae bacterium 26-R-25]